MNPILPQPAKGAWHSQSAEDVLVKLGSATTGLSTAEAAQRLTANGPNELKEGKRISPWQIFLGQFESLIIWILIVAGVISGVLGEMVDAIAIVAIGLFTFAAVELEKWLRFHTPQPIKIP